MESDRIARIIYLFDISSKRPEVEILLRQLSELHAGNPPVIERRELVSALNEYVRTAGEENAEDIQNRVDKFIQSLPVVV